MTQLIGILTYRRTCVPLPYRCRITHVVQAEHAADWMQRSKLPKEWAISKDDHVARSIISGLERDNSNPSNAAASLVLCAKCRDVQSDLWQPFRVSYETKYLRDSAKGPSCHLCEFFFQTSKTYLTDQASSILVERSGSCLKMNGRAVLSLFRSFGM